MCTKVADVYVNGYFLCRECAHAAIDRAVETNQIVRQQLEAEAQEIGN
jgi:hypothetical protein